MIRPKVSVCMPVFQGSRYIADAIESVLAQDYRDFELLVVDDSSGDSTETIVREYALHDSRVFFVANDSNLGMVANWKRCLAMARGSYIKFLFQDDILTFSDSLGKMVQALEDEPEVSLVAAARRVINRYSEVLRDEFFFENSISAKGADVIRYCILKHGNVIGEPSAVLFRKEQATRGFNIGYRQIVDLEMWFHLLEQGNFVYLGEPLCGFRVHAHQQTRKNIKSLAHVEDFDRLYREYLPKQYLGIGMFAREHIRFHQYYNLWKLSRRNMYNRSLALEKISRYYGTIGFFARMYLYKIFNPVYKLARSRYRRKILRSTF